eukprot:9517609-Karenia_brevis.AAC.1
MAHVGRKRRMETPQDASRRLSKSRRLRYAHSRESALSQQQLQSWIENRPPGTAPTLSAADRLQAIRDRLACRQRTDASNRA